MPRKRIDSKTTNLQDKKIKKAQPLFYQAVGRRKTATARVRLYPVLDAPITFGDFRLKGGETIVNGRLIKDYFRQTTWEKLYLEPFVATASLNRFAVSVKVSGSGWKGQLGAIIHGVARALCQADPKYRLALKSHGFLTRDARIKERRKPGLAGKARKRKQSPKR